MTGFGGLGLAAIWFRLAPALLLLTALLPAASLLYLRAMAASDDSLRDPVMRALFVAVPISAFLLAFFLSQARSRIHALKARETESLDPLCGLPDQTVLDACLDTNMADATFAAPVALVAIEVDQFEVINEAHGHRVGGLLLLGIAERIRRVISDHDCLARVGGGRLALLLPDATDASRCAAMAHRLHDSMMAPFQIGGLHLTATISIGIALAPQDGETRPTLESAADLALDRARREGRNRFAFFDGTMEQNLRLGMTIEDALRAAIEADELMILYQPVMSGCGTIMRGVEALVRWRHPTLGLIAPDDFIPLAERRGLIAPLGEWVLRRACRDSRRWPALRVAVNVSPVQFRNHGFVAMVKNIVADSGIEPHRLELELTEGVLIQDAEQAETVIMELRAQGIRMGLDDFGSGYSSMIYLRRFAFDKIKIDKALLESMEPRGESAIILDSIISLGHALGLTVTAEGVETGDQVEFLQKLGCDELQGYYFAGPRSADEIDVLLESQVGDRKAAEPIMREVAHYAL